MNANTSSEKGQMPSCIKVPQAAGTVLTQLLVELARSDREEDWARFVGLQSGAIAAICRSHLSNEYDVEDVVQETILAIRDGLAAFEPRDDRSSQAWVNTVAGNLARNFARNLGVRNRHQRHIASDPVDPKMTDDSDDDFDQRLSAVFKAISLLPKAQRRIIEMRYMRGMNNQNIAQELGIDSESVERSLLRSHVRLRSDCKMGFAALGMLELLRNIGRLQIEPITAATRAATSAKSTGVAWTSKVWVILGISLATSAGIALVAWWHPSPSPTTPIVAQPQTPDRPAIKTLDDFITSFKVDFPDWQQIPAQKCDFPRTWESLGSLKTQDRWRLPSVANLRTHAVLVIVSIPQANRNPGHIGLGFTTCGTQDYHFTEITGEIMSNPETPWARMAIRSDAQGKVGWSSKTVQIPEITRASTAEEIVPMLALPRETAQNQQPEITILIAPLQKNTP